METDFDVLIIGAGLSGISMACHLKTQCPGKRVALLERRKAIGGTWDLFRYPGVRSDSDMFTFGYRFRPWNELKVLADGESIRRYVEDTAREFGIDQDIRFGIKTTEAHWSSKHKRWTIATIDESSGEPRTFTCNYLVNCTGYYNHDQGHLPSFPGIERFQGQCVHPQHWPEALDYRGKRVVVIGSGATAVTLVPAMAPDTAHITMLQRSPSYVFSVPAYDKISAVLQRFLPQRWVYGLARRRNLLLQRLIYKLSKRWPDRMRSLLLGGVRKHVGEGFDMSHFSPNYKPWDERLCAVPDADLFKVLRQGKASIVTDHIDTFTEHGIRLKSGQELQADIVVTATGLQLQSFGGMTLRVDGQPCAINERMTYKGVLLQDVPNVAWLFGYINAPWTVKVDMAAAYVCRLLNHMHDEGADVVTPRAPAEQLQDDTILGALRSGYMQRGQAMLPRQGRSLPWRVLHDVAKDRAMLLKDPVEDSALEFCGAAPARAALSPALA